MSNKPVGEVREDMNKLFFHIYYPTELKPGDKLYAAPVAVPNAISVRDAISHMEKHESGVSVNVAYKFGWNACRAAMLNGGKS